MSEGGFTSGEDVFHAKGMLLDGCINNSCPHLRKHRKPVKAKQMVSGELNLLMMRTSTGKINYQNQDSSSTEKAVVGKAFSGSWVNFHSDKTQPQDSWRAAAQERSWSCRRPSSPACVPPQQSTALLSMLGAVGLFCSQGCFCSPANLPQYLPAKALGALISHFPGGQLGHQISGCSSPPVSHTSELHQAFINPHLENTPQKLKTNLLLHHQQH